MKRSLTRMSPPSDLVEEQVEHRPQPVVPLARKRAARLGLKTVGKFEQLRLEMVNGETLVIERALRSKRVRRVIKARTEPAGNIEAACSTDHADRIQAVSILQ